MAATSLLSHLSHRAARIYNESIVLDRDGAFCSRFFSRADSIGQKTLRSPYEHHLGTHNNHECELVDFARFNWEHLTPIEKGQVRMAQSGQRSVVPMDIFEAHTNHVIQVHGMKSLLKKGEALSIQRSGESYVVRGERFAVFADSVVICTGESRNDEHQYLGHQTVPWDQTEALADGDEVSVSGAGLTGAYLINKLLKRFSKVYWIKRGEARFQCSDVDAKFFRPEGRALFRNSSAEEQKALLGLHRRSSIMFEFEPILKAALDSGRLVSLESAAELPDDVPVVLAHGTQPELPDIDLALAAPIVDGRLPVDNSFRVREEAPSRLFAIGTHGVYAGGPAARNIDGIRYAAEVVASELARGDEK